ncbi:MAG: SDR family oxidoreductase [Deltaproteobacteria bacterium]|nr:SDR family oxidoreductase [Deltaproteobacteria bacterium]
MSDRSVAVITGGTRGLGLAIAERLAHAGHELVLVYHADEASAEAARAELAAVTSVRLEKADVSSPAQVEALAARLGSRVDVLIHSALRSGRPPRKTHELEVEAFTEDLSTNLIGAFTVCRAVLPAMMSRGFGRIVLVGSLAMRGEPGRVAYSVAKAGLVGLAKTIAKEYAKHGITANVVNPGFINAGAFSRLSQEIRERAVAGVPARRAGTAGEVAEAVMYLVGPGSGYVTGQVLSVDGGAS